MMATTHLLFGFLFGLFGIQFLHPYNQVLFMILVLFGSLLPDIDHPRSKLGRKVKFVSWLFEHRGFTHSIYALILVALISNSLTSNLNNTYGLLIGFMSHLVADSLSKEGVMFFHPLSKAKIRGIITTGSAAEYVLFVFLLALTIVKLIRL